MTALTPDPDPGPTPDPAPSLGYEAFAKTPAHAALIALGRSVDETGLEKSLTELVKLRVSQINGCAFCLQIHLALARGLGLSSEKIDLVAVWREAGVFSPRERAALAWAEALTNIGGGTPSDDDYAALSTQFDAIEAMNLAVAIGTINQWNRIAIALRFQPPPPRTAA